MDNINVILPCHFGLEQVLKMEVNKLSIPIKEVRDGEVIVNTTLSMIPKLNINIRTAERVLIEIKRFRAETFEELYEEIKKIDFKEILPLDSNIIIAKANQDKNSILHSSMSIQSIVKKAIVDKMMEQYKTRTLSEEGKKYSFRVKFRKNEATLLLDTTGSSLHKRGYRIKSSNAPIEETLASAIIMLTPFKRDRVLLDPFCGSGTFAIEAAMISANIAPNIYRAFSGELYKNLIDKKIWQEEVELAEEKIDYEFLKSKQKMIFASDIDPKMISISIDNAKRANVCDIIDFKTSDVAKVSSAYKNGFIITNPPYGERINDVDIEYVYNELKKLYDRLDEWSMFLISAYENVEKLLGKADKNRKIYNGMMKTYLYQYYGNYQK